MNYSMADGVLESINRIDNSQVDAFMEEFNKEVCHCSCCCLY